MAKLDDDVFIMLWIAIRNPFAVFSSGMNMTQEITLRAL